MSFNANYTWAKALTDVSLTRYPFSFSQNQYERALERADDEWIRRHQLRFSYIYELPFGKGKRFLPSPKIVLGMDKSLSAQGCMALNN